MKNNRVVFGSILVLAGALWLLRSLGIVNISLLLSFFKLWPLLFIAIGISIIFSRNTLVKTLTWILFFAVLVLYGIFGMPGRQINRNRNTGDGYMNYTRSVEMDKRLEQGRIRIEIGAADLKIGPTDLYLFDADITDRNVVFENDGDKMADVRIYSDMKTRSISDLGENNTWDVGLSSKIPWEVTIVAGAVEGELDFSDITLRKLDITIGASDMNIYLPDSRGYAEVLIRAGVSAIGLNVSADTGLKIRLKGLLTGKNFSNAGLIKEGDSYFSSNYENAVNRIDITIEMAIGDVDLKIN